MLAELYSQLVDLHFEVQRLAAARREGEARPVLDRILKLEGEITATPAISVEDALVKLRMLRVDIGASMSERQRRMMDEAMSALRKACEN
jgi:hypothetical protein